MSGYASQNLNEELVSSLDMIHEPEVYKKLVGRFPKQRELNWIKEMGKLIEVNAEEFHHHEENELIDTPIIASKSNGAGSSVVVVLKSDSHYISGTKSYPRVGDLVQFKNKASGLVTAKDESIPSAHTITIKPQNPSQDVQSAAVANDYFICYSSAFTEGTSGYNKSIVPNLTKFTNHCQIFSEYHEVTSSEKANQTYITYTNPETGETDRRYFIKGEADTADRFIYKEEYGLFLSPQADGLTDADGNTVKTTRGLIPHLEAYANSATYSDSITQAYYDAIVKLLNKNHADNEYMMMEGLNFALKNKDFHTSFGKNGSIVYDQKMVKLGFGGMEVAGFKFYFKKMDILNNPNGAGATGFPYMDYSILMPMGKGYDSKAAQYVDYFAVRYKKIGGAGDRGHYKVWTTGGASKSGTDASLKEKIHMASEKGLQVFGAKRYILTTKN